MSYGLNNNNLNGFKLHIEEAVFKKIMYWIDKSQYEVSGFGALEFDKEKGLFTATDAILLKQKVSYGSTEIDADSIAKAMFRLKDRPNALKWHWHSHVDFSVFWSGIDQDLIRQLGEQGWILASVLNQHREMRTAYYQPGPLGAPIFIDQIPTTVGMKKEKQQANPRLDKEYAEMVKVDTFVARVKDGVKKYWPDSEISESDWQQELETPAHIGKYIKPEMYSKYGWVNFNKKWVYNPYYNQMLISMDAVKKAMERLAPHQLDYLMKWDMEFLMDQQGIRTEEEITQ